MPCLKSYYSEVVMDNKNEVLIYEDKELPEISTVKKFLIVQNEGSWRVKRNIKYTEKEKWKN